MKKDKNNFKDINMEDIKKINNKLWKQSIKEYKEDKDSDISDLYKDAMNYRKYHSKLVADIAIKIFDSNITGWVEDFKWSSNCYERKILYLACLIHDIKKFDEKHSKEGAEWFRNEIEEYLIIDEAAVNDIFILIKEHSGKSEIEKDIHSKIRILVLIIKIADKLSKLQEKSNYKHISELDIKEKVEEICKASEECIPKKYSSNIENFIEEIQIKFTFQDGILIDKKFLQP